MRRIRFIGTFVPRPAGARCALRTRHPRQRFVRAPVFDRANVGPSGGRDLAGIRAMCGTGPPRDHRRRPATSRCPSCCRANFDESVALFINRLGLGLGLGTDNRPRGVSPGSYPHRAALAGRWCRRRADGSAFGWLATESRCLRDPDSGRASYAHPDLDHNRTSICPENTFSRCRDHSRLQRHAPSGAAIGGINNGLPA